MGAILVSVSGRRFGRLRGGAALALAAGLAGCYSPMVTSIRVREEDRGRVWEGTPYNLPRTALRITVAFARGKRPTLSLQTESVPDPGQQYVLVHNRNFLRSDKVKITLTKGPLLSKVKTTSKDETAALLADAGALAIAVARASKGVPAPTSDSLGALRMTLETAGQPGATAQALRELARRLLEAELSQLEGEWKTTAWLRPAGEGTFAVEGAALDGAASSFSIVGVARPIALGGSATLPDEGAGALRADHSESADEPSYDGVLTRSQVPCTLDLHLRWAPPDVRVEVRRWWDLVKADAATPVDRKEEYGLAVEEFQVAADRFGQVIERLDGLEPLDVVRLSTLAGVHDASLVALVPVDRAAFVEAKTELTFADGMLSDVDVDLPSSFGAAVTSPLDAAKAVLGVVTTIVKVNVDSAAASDAEKEKAKADREAKAAARDAALKKFYGDRSLVEQKRADYEATDWSQQPRSAQIRTAHEIVQGMMTANASARAAGVPEPYSDADMQPYLNP